MQNEKKQIFNKIDDKIFICMVCLKSANLSSFKTLKNQYPIKPETGPLKIKNLKNRC